ncbi:MAG TPA: quinoprotein dehydrogenase-associated putative ABC transporter substrate-binding protein, partial [Burkholderiales bacterium]
AAYFARAQRVPIALTPAHAPRELTAVPFEYSMSVGVRKADIDLLRELDAALLRRRADIDAILDEYGVPRAETVYAQSAQVNQ